jgi:hypothetical protein
MFLEIGDRFNSCIMHDAVAVIHGLARQDDIEKRYINGKRRGWRNEEKQSIDAGSNRNDTETRDTRRLPVAAATAASAAAAAAGCSD